MHGAFVGPLNGVLALLIGVPAVVGAVWGFSGSTPPRRAFGVSAGVVLGGLLVAIVFAFDISARETQVKAGWNLIPVVVAADDIKPGEVLTFDMISQRPIPEQFVPTSYLRPDDAARYVGKKVAGHMHAGDPLTHALMGEGLAPNACDLNPR